MYKLLISIILVILFTNETQSIKVKEIINRNATEHSERYYECIIKYSKQYHLDPVIIAKQIETESHFNHLAVSRKEAYGCSQIRVKYWDHLLYLIDNGNLGRYLRQKPTKICHIRYFFRIGYCIEVQSYIMSYLLKKYGSYELALVAYLHGENSKVFLKCVKKPQKCYSISYVRKILK